MRADPTRTWRVADLAVAAGLSGRRFRDFFAPQLGMSCRRYLPWIRLSCALGELARGASISEAAFAAGFVDAAHLTRTFRSMVGIVPSAIENPVSFMKKLA